MKRKIIAIALTVVMLSVISACGNTEEEPKETVTQDEAQSKTDNDSEEKDTIESQPQEEEIPGTEGDNAGMPAENVVSVKVYFSNEDATALDSEEVSIPSLSPEEVLGALISKGAVAADVRVLSFTTMQLEGKETIELDLNEAFSTYVTSMGTTGEYYVIGSICNTYLEAYGCEQIKITVEGKDLETGHAEYPGYMTRFE